MSGRRSIGAVLLLLGAALAACRGSVDSPSPDRRAAAVRRLAREPGDGPVPALLVAQRDPSALVRRAAAEALAERRGPHAAEALGAMLGDVDAGVAEAAASGLAHLGDLDASRGALVDAYAIASPAGREAIAGALAVLGVSLRDAIEAEARWRWARNVGALAAGSPEARAGAAEELGESGRSEAVARLRELLARPDEDPRVVVAIYRALGEAGDASVLPLLEAELVKGDPDAAQAAASALGRLGDPAATPALARMAAAGAGAPNRAALEALASLPAAPEVSQALCGVAQRSTTPSMAARAARAAWGRNADCPAASLAGRAARADPAALVALIELHPEPAVLAPLAGRLMALLSSASSSSDLRCRVADALGQLGWGPAAAPIEQRARAILERFVVARRAWIPGRFRGDPAPLPTDPQARFAALRTRPALVPPRDADAAPSVPEWIDPTTEDDREELGTLLTALGRLQASSARALLSAAIQDPSTPIRAGAVEGMGYLGGDPAPELVAALTDRSERVRLAALRGLPRYGPAAVPPLAAAARSAQSHERQWSEALARALGATGAPDALVPLTILLDGPAPGAAATAIAAVGVAAGAEPLLAHLSRKDAPGRVETLDALAQLASPRAGPAIADELLSENPDVRIAAARAIGKLKYEPGSRRLEALRVDYDGRVRRATIEALARLPSGRPRSP
ncbi:MAG TPA: HEAT repeat domain-containing protein [Anaeromyxobacteraceae bacterium]|nr:HEAT repeat domain-containing protein [Anaeromyxobacteraceae bacterium]